MVLGKPCEGVVVHRLRTSGMECLRKEATGLSGTGSRGLKSKRGSISVFCSVRFMPILIEISLPLEGKESICPFRLLSQSSVISAFLDSLTYLLFLIVSFICPSTHSPDMY